MLPDGYRGLNDTELKSRIKKVKDKFGKKLVILGHHYQRDDVVGFADFIGDSLKLSQDAAREKDAEFIVFCGVHFMAESARILCKPAQRVFLPDMEAGCPMAEMASIEEVEAAWDEIAKCVDISSVVPVTYINSLASIKAFCGRNGGVTCTSGNASKIFDWASKRGEKIFFLPDEHLGRNTAHEKDISNKQIIKWNRQQKDGGCSSSDIRHARVILWDGFCHVHTYFTKQHVLDVRQKYPGCKIIVHSECTEDVVAVSDDTGSTEQIKKYVENLSGQSTIIVGTEINMVARLAKNNPDKNVFPLARSLCPNMFKTSLNNLCWTLENLGEASEIFVDEMMARDARLALERMLFPDKRV